MEIEQPSTGSALTVTDGVHTVTNTGELSFIGATVTNSGGGIATITITGGGGTPASPDTSVQFNNGGSFGGSADFVWDNANQILSIGDSGQGILTLGVNSLTGTGFNQDQQPTLIFVNNLTFAFSQPAGSTDNGGSLSFLGNDGGATSGAGGGISFTAGSGIGGNSDGGNILFLPGVKHGAGTVGRVQFRDPVSGLNANIDASLLATIDKTFTFPNVSGIFAVSSGALTQGSVLFAGANGIVSQNNSTLFWDDTFTTLSVSGHFFAGGTTTGVYVVDSVIQSAYAPGTSGSGNIPLTIQQAGTADLTFQIVLGGNIIFNGVSAGYKFLNGTKYGIFDFGSIASTDKTFTFPNITDTIVTLNAVQTLTNKRITRRVVTASNATSITPNTDNADVTYQANTQSAGTLTINADTGTPTNGQMWLLKIKSTNVQTYSWNSQYVSGSGTGGITLPTASTGSSKIDYVLFIYDTVNSKWQCVGTPPGY